MRKGASSPSKADLIGRDAIGRFVPTVQEILLNDSALAEETVSLVLNNHFPDSVHEDILEATGLEQLQPVKPKRDSRFREEVLRAYGYRCTVCGFDLRLDNVPLALDAAHIRWHQANGPSIVSNGLALCSLHHKLFDRGAFSLSEKFKIEVSARVNGSVGLKEHLAPFSSNPITLPSVTAARPNQDFVRWHRTEVFHLPIADVLSIT